MFYRSGWLRCDVFKCIGFGFELVFVYVSSWCFDVRCYIILYYILYYTYTYTYIIIIILYITIIIYYILYYLILFSLSSVLPFLLSFQILFLSLFSSSSDLSSLPFKSSSSLTFLPISSPHHSFPIFLFSSIPPLLIHSIRVGVYCWILISPRCLSSLLSSSSVPPPLLFSPPSSVLLLFQSFTILFCSYPSHLSQIFDPACFIGVDG